MILASQLKPKQLLILYLVNQCIRKNKLRAEKQPGEELAEIWLELSDGRYIKVDISESSADVCKVPC